MTSTLAARILDFVRRTPNMAVSQWGKYTDSDQGRWRKFAACSGRDDLPWTDDLAPGLDQRIQMDALCEGCPVRRSCAQHSLSQLGGFHAGVWLPWPLGEDETRSVIDRTRRERERALRELKVLSRME